MKLSRHGPGASDAWVHQVALRTAIDHHRARVRRKAREEKVAESAPSPRVESALPVAEALAGLPEEERTLLVDHFFGRKTLRKLADERGCSEPAVWKRVEKGKEQLRKVLLAAAPAAVLAMDAFLEASPSRWTPTRIAIAAAVPALVVAGLALVGLGRRQEPPPLALAKPRPAPVATAFPVRTLPEAAPAAPAPRPADPAAAVPPYPYELPPRHWAAPQRTAWAKLDHVRLDINAENQLLHVILSDLSTGSGLVFRLAPDVPVPTSPITFKVKDLTLRNSLKLLLSQFDLASDFGSDGTVWVRAAKGAGPEPDPRFEEVQAVRRALDLSVRAMDGGWKGVPVDPVWAALRAKDIAIPPGQYSLGWVVDRLREESGLSAAISGGFATGDPELERQEREMTRRLMALESEDRPLEARALGAGRRDLRRRMEKAGSRPFQGGSRTLEAHLQEIESTWKVTWAPSNGMLLIVDPERGAKEMARAKEELRAQTAGAERLCRPLLGSAPKTVYELADALARETRLKVVPTERAWTAPIPAAGGTWKDVLEASGLRWILTNDTVAVDR